MYAQCPECLTVFALDAATIALAHGCVGCGNCGATFDTMATLTDDLPAAPYRLLELNHPSAEPPLIVHQIEHQVPPQPGLFEPEPEASSTAEVAADSDDEESCARTGSADSADSEHTVTDLEQEPSGPARVELDLDAEIAALSGSFTRRERMGEPLRKRLIMGCVALAVCLALQLAWAERTALARSPLTGPLVHRLCDVFHCSPLVKDLTQLGLVSRDVRKHPSVADALIISATIRNHGTFAQPFPIIVINLSDLRGNRVAMRRFRPTEYLHDAQTRAAGLAPGASTALVFEVEDPGQNAVAFEFSFE